MSNRKRWYKIRYFILTVTLLITAIGVYKLSMDMSGVSAELFVSNLDHNSHVFTMYFNDFVEEHISRLEDTASSLGEGDPYDKKKTKKFLKTKKRDFSVYTILLPTGEKEFDGLGDTSMNFSLVKSDYLDTIVQDKKTVIYGSLIQDDNREKYMAFCSPIVIRGEVSCILMGAVRISELNDLMQRWELTQEGCAFVMSERGSYITSGERFYEMIGGEANDFMTYIDSCSIRKGSPSVDEIEQNIKKRKDMSIRYGYNGRDYVLELFAGSDGNWYICYLLQEKSFYAESFHFSNETAIFLMVAAALWVIVVIYGIILVYQNGKGKELLERYKTVSELDKSIMFEMRFSPKKFSLYGDVKEFFAVDKSVYSGEAVYDIYDRIHPDDVSVRSRIHKFYEDFEKVFTAEVRIKNGEDTYGWFRIIGTLIKDPRNGMNQKFVGKIESADEEIADEKDLMERAENDLLTGVLNKKTMEERVVESLKNMPGSSYRIFFMVDLDNFKNVNDKLGHIVGDKAIVDTAERLSEIFHSDAFVGRLGGDEFAVCAKYNAFDEESLYKYIKKKADKICEVNRRTYSNGELEVRISSSVGIAIAPDMATDFENLYKKADSALYKSKNGGKNCYHIFGKD